jgi:hypothetical protein
MRSLLDRVIPPADRDFAFPQDADFCFQADTAWLDWGLLGRTKALARLVFMAASGRWWDKLVRFDRGGVHGVWEG